MAEWKWNTNSERKTFQTDCSLYWWCEAGDKMCRPSQSINLLSITWSAILMRNEELKGLIDNWELFEGKWSNLRQHANGNILKDFCRKSFHAKCYFSSSTFRSWNESQCSKMAKSFIPQLIAKLITLFSENESVNIIWLPARRIQSCVLIYIINYFISFREKSSM